MNENDLHFRKKINANGITQIVSPENSALQYISLDILEVDSDESIKIYSNEYEKAIIILSGSCTVTCGDKQNIALGFRESVFSGKASAVYLPPNNTLEVKGKTKVTIAIASSPSSRKGIEPIIIMPDDVKTKTVGKDNWQREVHDIISGDFDADRLIIGETFNPPGNWSSCPPHKHDQHNPPHESRFEEVYFYQLDPQQGFGIQRVYTSDEDIDQTYAVQHNDAIVLPRGYHPVVAAPGYKLYYLWILAGKGRTPCWSEDPAHSWIHTT